MAIKTKITLINGEQIKEEVYSKFIIKEEGVQLIKIKKYFDEEEYKILFKKFVVGKIYNVIFDNRIDTNSLLKKIEIVSIIDSPLYLLLEFEVINKVIYKS